MLLSNKSIYKLQQNLILEKNWNKLLLKFYYLIY